jgi:hypothetical protein
LILEEEDDAPCAFFSFDGPAASVTIMFNDDINSKLIIEQLYDFDTE